MKRKLWLLATLAAIALSMSTQGVSRAEAVDPSVKAAERLNKKAMEDYDSLEFDSARQTLLAAIAKLREAGQDETATAAKIYTNLGIVYISGFKDKNRGVQQFVNALKIDPTTQLDPERATPELQEAFEAAVKQAGSTKKTPKEPKEPPKEPKEPKEPPKEPKEPKEPVPAIKGMEHNPVDEAKAGQDVVIKTQIEAALPQARVVLFYRGGGQEDFVALPMDKGKNLEWTGTIPGDAVNGKSVQYYIEARDAKGRPTIASGSAASPYIISVKGNPDDEDPLAAKRKKPTTTAKAKDDCSSISDEALRERCRKGRGYGRLYFSLMGGVGIGVQPEGNHTEVAYQYKVDTGQYRPQPVGTTGVALAPFHLSIELGANLTQNISLGVLYRGQLVTGANADSTVSSGLPGGFGNGTAKAIAAHAGLLRFKYRFGGGRFHPYIHVDVGAGQIRHMLDISTANTDPSRPLADFQTSTVNSQFPIKPGGQVNEVCPAASQSTCIDTIAIGLVLLGGGAGLWIDVAQFKNGGVGIVADLNILAAVGDQFGMNFDLQVGLGFHVF